MAQSHSSFVDPPPGTFVAIDFETADTGADSACEVGLIRVENGKFVRRVRQLIKPPREDIHFTHIHGIRWGDVEDKPTFGEAWPLLQEVFEGARFIAAHNAAFDRGVMHACCSAAELDPPDLPWVCTVREARRVLGIRPADLASVCRFMGFELDHHHALSDAEACARIVLASRRVLQARES